MSKKLKDLLYSITYDIDSSSIDKVESNVKQLEKTTSKSFGGMEGAAGKFNKSWNQMSDNITSSEMWTMGDTIGDIGSSLTKKLTLPIVGLGVASAKFGKDYEATMKTVQAVTGATDDEINKLSDSLKGVDGGIFNKIDKGEVSIVYSRAGVDIDSIDKIMEDAIDHAIGNEVDLEAAANLQIIGSNIFNTDIEESSKVLDTFSAVANKTNTNVNEMFEAMESRGGVAFASLGYDVTDFAWTMGLLADKGIAGTIAGTQINAALTQLAKPTTEGLETMDKYGISLLDASGNMKPFPDLLYSIQDSMGSLDEDIQKAELTRIFGRTGAGAIQALINSDRESMDKLLVSAEDYAGTNKEMRKIIEESFDFKWEKLKTQGIDMLIEGFMAIEPLLSSVVSGLTSVFTWVSNLGPVGKGVFLGILGVLALIGPALLFTETVMKLMAITSVITGTTGAASFGLMAGAVWAATWPILAVIAALALVGGAIYLLVKNWDAIKEAAGVVWDWVTDKVSGVYNFLKDKTTQYVQNSIDRFNKIKDFIFGIPGAIKDAAGKAKDYLLDKFQPVADFIEGLRDKISDLLWSARHPIKSIQGKIDGNSISETRSATEKIDGNSISETRSATEKIDGRHRTGLNKVPKDNYKGLLHKDEMVLPKSTADKYREQGGTINNIPVPNDDKTKSTADKYREQGGTINNIPVPNDDKNDFDVINNNSEYSPEATTKETNNNVSYNPSFSVTVEGGGDLGLKTKYELEKLIKRLQQEGMEDFFYTLRLRTN